MLSSLKEWIGVEVISIRMEQVRAPLFSRKNGVCDHFDKCSIHAYKRIPTKRLTERRLKEAVFVGVFVVLRLSSRYIVEIVISSGKFCGIGKICRT